jgi:hypothetical protein
MLHADGVLVSHLFLAVDIGGMSLYVAVATNLAAIIL